MWKYNVRGTDQNKRASWRWIQTNGFARWTRWGHKWNGYDPTTQDIQQPSSKSLTPAKRWMTRLPNGPTGCIINKVRISILFVTTNIAKWHDMQLNSIAIPHRPHIFSRNETTATKQRWNNFSSCRRLYKYRKSIYYRTGTKSCICFNDIKN